jgi:hypothetical protein
LPPHSIDHCGDEKAKIFRRQLAIAMLFSGGSTVQVVVGEDFGYGEAVATPG